MVCLSKCRAEKSILSSTRNSAGIVQHREAPRRYCRGLGLPEHVAFTDILSTEDWALEMVPSPVLAVLLLFPISDAEEKHRGEENDRVASAACQGGTRDVGPDRGPQQRHFRAHARKRG